MRKAIVLLALAAFAALPAHADPTAAAASFRSHTVESGVYRPLGGVYALGAPEISFLAGMTEVLVDTAGTGEGEGPGACIDVYIDGVFDSGCGPLTIEVVPFVSTKITGTIATEATRYDPEEGFIPIGPSQLHLDLTFTGSGAISPDPSSPVGVGVCGFPFTQGVSVLATTRLTRAATITGTFTSDYHGAIDTSVMEPEIVESSWNDAGACA